MPIFAFIVLFFFLELFLLFRFAIDYGWGVFWFEVATAFIGVFLIRRNQEFTMREMFRQSAGQTRVNFGLTMLRSARITACGLLLILPGFITDSIGAVLLVLPGIHAFLFGLIKSPTPPPPKPPASNRSGRIVDGEAERLDDSAKR